MKYYRGKETGHVVAETDIDESIKNSYELIRGEENMEFNIMEIEYQVSKIRKIAGWILFFIAVPALISLVWGILQIVNP